MVDVSSHLDEILQDVEVLKMLAEKETRENAQTELREFKINGLTLAHLAIINNRPRVLDYLLDEFISTELEDADGDTLLFYAVGAENPRANECVEELLNHQANVRHRNKNRATPLMTAAYMDNLYAIEKLLEYGADINAHDNVGRSAIVHAASNINIRIRRTFSMPSLEAILTLLRAGASVEELYHSGYTLCIGSTDGMPTIVRLGDYSPSLLFRDDLCLAAVNLDNPHLMQYLLS